MLAGVALLVWGSRECMGGKHGCGAAWRGAAAGVGHPGVQVWGILGNISPNGPSWKGFPYLKSREYGHTGPSFRGTTIEES